MLLVRRSPPSWTRPILKWAILGLVGAGLSLLPDEFYKGFIELAGPKLLTIVTLLSILVALYVSLFRSKQKNAHRVVDRGTGNPDPTRATSHAANIQVRNETRDAREDMLRHLSADEKALLRLHFDGDNKCLAHSLEKGAALGLRTNGILFVPSQITTPTPIGFEQRVTYCVSDWAWRHLKKNPRLLK